MQLFSVQGNSQRLDGGAMFGNCPKPLWEKWIAPDEANRIPLSCRCLLVREASGRHVLLETGIGAFFEPKLKDRFGVVESEHKLIENLAALGVAPADIDVVVLSHLHFDHAGGMLTPHSASEKPELVFGKARFVVGREAWDRALHPHPRDRASFIPKLHALLESSGRLEVTEGDRSTTLGDAYRFTTSSGHTPGMMLTRVEGASEGPITFCGDLIPGAPWVHLPITMGYDRYPELLVDEKRELLARVESAGEWLFFTHDPTFAASRVKRDERGRFSADAPIETLAWS